jgi:ZIP family zinc transporter
MESASPVLLALLGGLFTWAMTAAGSSLVLLGRAPRQRVLDVLLGFSAGIMLSASYFSLLGPSLEMSMARGATPWLAPTMGFLVGALGLSALDRVLPHIHRAHRRRPVRQGLETQWRRSTLLILAVTLHNIPEGLALGVAVGAAASGDPAASAGAAIALALGLGLQNLPEGLAVSAPLRREGMSRWRSAWYGQLSGIVEPMAAVLGAWLVAASRAILPLALAFAAGAMVFVVIEELVPECQRSGHADAAVVAAIVGFALMMVLDVALG